MVNWNFKLFIILIYPPPPPQKKNVWGKICALVIIAQSVKFHKQTPRLRDLSHSEVDNISPTQKD